MRSVSPYQSYRQVATRTASPGQLVLMLFEGAVRFLDQARTGFASEDPVVFNQTINNNLLRAQQIVAELNNSLNLQEGGEFGQTMRRLYEYFDWRLQVSNMQKQEDGIVEVIRHLTVLRDAWAEMLRNQGVEAASASNASALLMEG